MTRSNRRRLSLDLLLPVLVASVSCPAQDEAKPVGTVTGSITTTTKLTSRGAQSQVELVVWLEPKEKIEVEKKERTAEVQQRRLQFEPRALPVLVGTKVVFLNEDRVTHNVFIESQCCHVDQDAKTGEKITREFAEPGVFPVVCRLHPEMTMTVIALRTPWFVAAKFEKKKAEDGTATYVVEFAIENVPPGKYVLRTWNKKLAPIEQELEVKAAEATKVVVTAEK